MEQHVIVVGAGLAGLAAAYELRNDPNTRVTVLERNDRVGGRVRCLPVRGRPVDFGGFIIFPWYREYHRLAAELGLRDRMEHIPLDRVYYQLDQSGRYHLETKLPLPAADTARLTLKLAKPILASEDPANPPLDAFARKTVSACFRDALRRPDHAGVYETYADVAAQGYCYPGVEEYKMAFMAAFIRPNDVSGRKKYFFRDGSDLFPRALADAITAAGHAVRTGVTVNGCSGQILRTNGGDMRADQIIFAQPLGDALAHELLPDAPPAPAYTRYETVALELGAIPSVEETTDWSAVFFLPTRAPVQVVSVVNLEKIYGTELRGCVNANVVIRDPNFPSTAEAEEILSHVLPTVAERFPGTNVRSVASIAHWQQTMPNAREEFVEHVRARQGTNGYYFAGDWLGAPSMETALRTGIRAARLLRERTSGVP